MARVHVVEKGDTLGKIARRYYRRASLFTLIVSANPIANPDKLRIGQRLVIPDAASSPPASEVATPRTPLPDRPEPSSSPVSEQRLCRVHPALASRVRAMIDRCARNGLSIVVTQGLRTSEEQDALYAKGRTVQPIGAKYIVTKARGGQSYHNFGLAVDIVILDALGKCDWNADHPGWKAAAAVGKSLGLEWGGDWTGFKDVPHFQYTGNLALNRCRELVRQGLQAVWAEVA